MADIQWLPWSAVPFARARAAATPSLLHLKLDPQAITPNTPLDALREQGLAAKR